MKKIIKGMLFAVLMVSLVFGLFACGGGGDSPKALAKQQLELMKKQDFTSPAAKELQRKIDALSVDQRTEYNREFYRLTVAE